MVIIGFTLCCAGSPPTTTVVMDPVMLLCRSNQGISVNINAGALMPRKMRMERYNLFDVPRQKVFFPSRGPVKRPPPDAVTVYLPQHISATSIMFIPRASILVPISITSSKDMSNPQRVPSRYSIYPILQRDPVLPQKLSRIKY